MQCKRGTQPCQLSGRWEEERRLCVIANCGRDPGCFLLGPESTRRGGVKLAGYAALRPACLPACRWIWLQTTWVMSTHCCNSEHDSTQWLCVVSKTMSRGQTAPGSGYAMVSAKLIWMFNTKTDGASSFGGSLVNISCLLLCRNFCRLRLKGNVLCLLCEHVTPWKIHLEWQARSYVTIGFTQQKLRGR